MHNLHWADLSLDHYWPQYCPNCYLKPQRGQFPRMHVDLLSDKVVSLYLYERLPIPKFAGKFTRF